MDTCPTVDQLRLWLAGKLDEPQSGQVEAHIENCAAVCQPLLDEMSGSRTLAAPREGPRQFLRAAALQRPGGGRSDFLPGYRIEGDNPIGQGAMGVVWKATQVRMNRTVALKVMHAASFGSERARLRFEREVELTAKLVHPHIVRVYDTGSHKGVCYYAMELIEGQDLRAYVTAHKLAPSQIIEMMKVISRAVQHAHEHGIIHRDLKPANILVDPGGQPHVLDFGLAKPLEADVQLTQDDMGPGTPAYMSPEQADGRYEGLNTRSDVYTLGVILFNLLCGRFPHDISGSLFEVRRRIANLEPLKLRSAAPHVDREFEVLVAKALAREPADRYATAGELADDLDRYLRGDPIGAKSPTILYLLSKKVRRHRLSFSAAAGVIMVVLAMAFWSYGRITRERNLAVAATAEKERQRQEADRQHVEAIRQRDLADANARRALKGEAEAHRQERIAREQEDVADDQRHLAIQTLEDLIFRLRDKLNRPGLQDVKESVFSLALDGLRRIERSVSSETARADRDSAVTHHQIGDVLLALGRTSEANDAYQAALNLGDQLANADPSNLVTLSDVAVFCDALGELHLQYLRNPTTARTYYARSLAAHERLFQADPSNRVMQYGMALACGNMGSVCARQGDTADAREYLGRCVTQLQALALAEPSELRVQGLLLSNYKQLGELDPRFVSRRAARDLYLRSVKALETIAGTVSGGNVEEDFEFCYKCLGETMLHAGEDAAAKKCFAKSLEASQSLVRAEPSNVRYQLNLAESYISLGGVDLNLGDTSAANDELEKGLKAAQALAITDSSNAAFEREVSIALEELGLLRKNCGQTAAAKDYLQRALAIHSTQSKANPADMEARLDVARLYNSLGIVSEDGHEPVSAKRYYAQALETCQSVPHPADIQTLELLRIIYHNLGCLGRATGDLAGVRDSAEKCLKVVEDMSLARPSDPSTQGLLADALLNLGDLSLKADELAAARGFLERGLTTAQALAKSDPTGSDIQHQLWRAFDGLGVVRYKLKDPVGAKASFEQAIRIAEAMTQADPLNKQRKWDLATSCSNLVAFYLQANDFSEAKQPLDRWLSLAEGFVRTDPRDSIAKGILHEGCYSMGMVLEGTGRKQQALEFYERAEMIAREIDAAGSLGGQLEYKYTRNRDAVRARIEACRRKMATQPATEVGG